VGVGTEWWALEPSGGRQSRVDPSGVLWIRQTQQSSLLNMALVRVTGGGSVNRCFCSASGNG